MIAYDTNILIYALEGTSPWAAAAQEVIVRGESDGAVLSILAWQELMTGAVIKGDGSDDSVVRALDALSATRFAHVSHEICKRAVTLTQQYGRQVYGYDAIHLATALEHKATEFITNDRALLGIRVDGLIIRGLSC